MLLKKKIKFLIGIALSIILILIIEGILLPYLISSENLPLILIILFSSFTIIGLIISLFIIYYLFMYQQLLGDKQYENKK